MEPEPSKQVSSEPLQCENCLLVGRVCDAIGLIRIGRQSVPLCQYCALELMQQCEGHVASWSLRTGQDTPFGPSPGKQKTWADLEIDVHGHKKGTIRTGCPACEKGGEPLMVDLDAGTALCLACSEQFSIES